MGYIPFLLCLVSCFDSLQHPLNILHRANLHNFPGELNVTANYGDRLKSPINSNPLHHASIKTTIARLTGIRQAIVFITSRLEAEAEGCNRDMARDLILKDGATEVNISTLRVGIVEGLVRGVLRSAILISEVEVNRARELYTEARSDILLACGDGVARDDILIALAEGATAIYIARTHCQEGQQVCLSTHAHRVTTLEHHLCDVGIVEAIDRRILKLNTLIPAALIVCRKDYPTTQRKGCTEQEARGRGVVPRVLASILPCGRADIKVCVAVA